MISYPVPHLLRRGFHFYCKRRLEHSNGVCSLPKWPEIRESKRPRNRSLAHILTEVGYLLGYLAVYEGLFARHNRCTDSSIQWVKMSFAFFFKALDSGTFFLSAR